MTNAPSSTISDRLAEVRAVITAACARAGRSVDSVTLVAVSKTHPAWTVLEAVEAGQLHFGENRIEEAEAKIANVTAKIFSQLTWHMVGHVQSRKAEAVVSSFDVIHSLDSIKLAERFSRFAVEQGKDVRVLLEMNVSGEESKSGFDAVDWQNRREKLESLWAAIRQITMMPGIRIEGLMTIAPIVDEMEAARPVFAALRSLRDNLAADFPSVVWSTLSMGMTDDYPVAIEEGATVVRIGRAIFGPRTIRT
jgi:pyridoxal phosphate enzyme (YggS family)